MPTEEDMNMSYYGGTITVSGRALITQLIAGETIEFTRVVVGSGSMPDGVEPIDMTELVSPVANASSTVPIVENGVLLLTVEYRNDMNGGLQTGFWLSEFGIYAKTDKSPEVLLYYATLGDSPQPVNAYKDNRVDIRRYPISIALEVDADIQVAYNPGAFITASEASVVLDAMVQDAVNKIGSSTLYEVTIPADGWKETSSSTDNYGENYCNDVALENSKYDQYPVVSLSRGSIDAAREAGMSNSVHTMDGVIRFWAEKIPADDINVTVALLSSGSYSIENKERYVLPIATDTQLGGVKIGDGVQVSEDGTISVKLGSGMSLNDEGEISVKLGNGMDVNDDGEISASGDVATSEDTSEMLDDIFSD
jgi:hypothetical protein